MRKERMTVEELNSLKPSYDNPITLECDDGHYTSHLKIIKVVTPVHNDQVAVIDSDGDLNTLSILHHYPSLKPETEKKRWFELWITGRLGDVFLADTVVDSDFRSASGILSHCGHKRALGKEVTDEIEKLEWK